MSIFLRFSTYLTDMSIPSTYQGNEALMSYDRNTPYNELPDLPPKVAIETTAILKMAIRAIAELRVSGHLIPNQAVLIQALGLSEYPNFGILE